MSSAFSSCNSCNGLQKQGELKKQKPGASKVYLFATQSGQTRKAKPNINRDLAYQTFGFEFSLVCVRLMQTVAWVRCALKFRNG